MAIYKTAEKVPEWGFRIVLNERTKELISKMAVMAPGTIMLVECESTNECSKFCSSCDTAMKRLKPTEYVKNVRGKNLYITRK